MNASIDVTASASARPGRIAIRAVTGVLVLTGLIRLFSLGAYPLFDKTEARYALIGELMHATGNWITPLIELGVPFWAKPPLSVWGTALSYAAFGVNEFAARFPSLILLALVAYLVFAMATAMRDRDFGLVAVCVFASTGLSFYLAGGVMTDPALLLGVTVTMVAFWNCMSGPNRAWGFLFFVGLVIALLAKGPIGVVLPGVSIAAWVAWHNKWRETWRNLPWIAGTLLTVVLVVPWYVIAERATPGFLDYFIIGEHFQRFVSTGWSGDLYGGPRVFPYGTIWLFGLLAMLPWSFIVLLLPFHRRLRQVVFNRKLIRDPWLSYLVFWFFGSLVFFTVPRIILITYVATSLPAFALLTAHVLRRLGDDQRPYRIALIAALMPLVCLAFVIANRIDAFAFSPVIPTQKHIVHAYEAQRRGADYNLVYLLDRPFSAEFYSARRAKLALTAADAARLLQEGRDPFFAIASARLIELPADLRARLQTAVERNGTLLLRPVAR